MTTEETRLWDAIFGIKERVMDEIAKRELYVADIDVTKALPDIDSAVQSNTYTDQLARRTTARKHRINFDEEVEAPIVPFNPDGMTLLVKPQIHLGGGSRGNLYNAFISMHTYIQDKFGRLGLSVVEGTRHYPGNDWRGLPVYSPYIPASVDVWFNTSIDRRPFQNGHLDIK